LKYVNEIITNTFIGKMYTDLCLYSKHKINAKNDSKIYSPSNVDYRFEVFVHKLEDYESRPKAIKLFNLVISDLKYYADRHASDAEIEKLNELIKLFEFYINVPKLSFEATDKIVKYVSDVILESPLCKSALDMCISG
jgi:hypothetical protein